MLQLSHSVFDLFDAGGVLLTGGANAGDRGRYLIDTYQLLLTGNGNLGDRIRSFDDPLTECTNRFSGLQGLLDSRLNGFCPLFGSCFPFVDSRKDGYRGA